ncbi:MAG: NAD(P)H-dependent flavin oxidoreductase [Candidatus Tectimicrobiota bacterium]
MSTSRPVFHTRLCDLLGMDYPILQSGMGGIAGPALAATVSNAGGLGMLAGFLLTAEQLRDAIRALRQQTQQPFGVNLLLPPEVRPPMQATDLSASTVQAVQSTLNPLRAHVGLPPQAERPAQLPDLIPACFQVILEERVPVFSVGLGNPGAEMVEACHRHGIKVIAMATSVEDARLLEATGVDAVVAQGAEAGGHRSHFTKPATGEIGTIGTVALVPEVVDAVRLPVIAAGGMADGRGLVSALTLGASGVLMGTRFVATRESMAPEAHKKALLESSATATTLTDVLSGRFARALRNAFTATYAHTGAPVLPFPWQAVTAGDIYREAARQGNADYLPLWGGQSLGVIHDLPGAAEVIETIILEARALLLERLPQTVALEQ